MADEIKTPMFSVPKFGFAGFCLLIGLITFAIQQGCSVTGNAPSWLWGTVWFCLAIGLVLLAIWFWDQTASHHWIRKLLLSLVAIGVIGGLSYIPVAKQYRAEHIRQASPPQPHQASEAQQQTSSSPTPSVMRTKPAISSVAPSKEKPPTLLDLFKKDFPGVVSLSDKGFDLQDSTGQVGAHVDWRLLMDFPSKSEFIAFYVPPVRDEVPVCIALIDTVHPTINRVSQNLDASAGFAGESTSLRDLTFSGRVFIYHEWPLSNKQKADIVEAYSAKGLDVQFRGVDYLGEKLIAWHQQHGVKTVH